MRDVIFLPNVSDEYLVIAADNSAGVGEKDFDVVQVDYETVAYFGLRVALSECLAVGATPIALVIQNFIGDEEWDRLKKGCCKIFSECDMEPIPITGSTESNFSMVQSAVGIIVIGKVKKDEMKIKRTTKAAKFACIGRPLVGEEVIKNKEEIAPLSLIQKLLDHKSVYEIVPVGSKGIQFEWNELCQENGLNHSMIVSKKIDIKKSAGPATCFLLSYDPAGEKEIAAIAGRHFYRLYTGD